MEKKLVLGLRRVNMSNMSKMSKMRKISKITKSAKLLNAITFVKGCYCLNI